MTGGRQLRDDGYCVISGVLGPDMLGHVQKLAAGCVADISVEHRAQWRSEGSLVHVGDYPAFADLIAYRPALDALAGMALDDIRFSSGYVISKPPGGPPLFWHQDWWGWDEAASRGSDVFQVFLFYYLTDTTPENGCLRVIPGSHRRRHALHGLLDAHSAALARADDPTSDAFGSWDGEVAVPVRAGDLVVGDARLLHGAFGNGTDQERTLITLWYHADFARQPAALQTRVWEIYRRAGSETDTDRDGGLSPQDWPAAARAKIAALVPEPALAARGVAPQPWNRTPVGLA